MSRRLTHILRGRLAGQPIYAAREKQSKRRTSIQIAGAGAEYAVRSQLTGRLAGQPGRTTGMVTSVRNGPNNRAASRITVQAAWRKYTPNKRVQEDRAGPFNPK
jgi:hypothetical protein